MVEDEVHVEVLVDDHRRLCRLHIHVLFHLEEVVDHEEDVQHEELVLEGISAPLQASYKIQTFAYPHEVGSPGSGSKAAARVTSSRAKYLGHVLPESEHLQSLCTKTLL